MLVPLFSSIFFNIYIFVFSDQRKKKKLEYPTNKITEKKWQNVSNYMIKYVYDLVD